MRIAIALFLPLLGVSCTRHPAVTETHSTRDFALGLQPVESRVRAGTIPQFRLTLTNVSEHTCRILNAEARVDLQHTYYNLVVTQCGTNVWVGRMISDPGPIDLTDWLEIQPSQRREFVLTDFPDWWERLLPGDYEAYIDFWRDPAQSHTTRYRSQIARFTVFK